MTAAPQPGRRPRLIATDLDGTLLASDHVTISPRNRAALALAADAGVRVVALSGRQPYSIAAIVAGTPLEGLAVGSNGSVGMDLATGQVFFEELIGVDEATAFARALLGRFPGVRVTSVRDAGNSYLAQHGYVEDMGVGISPEGWPVVHRFTDLDEVLGAPSVKLVFKDPAVASPTLLEAVRDLGLNGCHATVSGAPFLEVARAGVTKGSALARLCQDLGIAPSDVVAFGDNNNDVEMLAFAGRGVAMANGTPEAKAAADEVTGTADEDGFAQVVERLLA